MHEDGLFSDLRVRSPGRMMGTREPRKWAELRGRSGNQCLALAGSQHQDPSRLNLGRARPGDDSPLLWVWLQVGANTKDHLYGFYVKTRRLIRGPGPKPCSR